MLFVDDLLDLDSLSQVTWIAANNLDPMRDCFHTASEPGRSFNTLCMDATRKYRGRDDFQRDWPNIIVMDEQTIATVDGKWAGLGIGPFMDSPSRVYHRLVTGPGAVAPEEY
jgi:4-hydroxy-3-polyprenylbenzoate decarboxylase